MNKQDRRSRRTEDALLRALAELLKRKELRSISVNELVQLAGLHRSTFYTHYSDIYALYHQTEEKFLAVYQDLLKESELHDYTGIFRSILSYMDENRVASEMFFGPHAEPTFRNRLTEFIIEQYLRISAYEDGVQEPSPRWRALAAYHVGGMMSLAAAWVQSGYAIPKEELSELYIELDYSLADLRRKELKG